jgi:hypothetical protein
MSNETEPGSETQPATERADPAASGPPPGAEVAAPPARDLDQTVVATERAAAPKPAGEPAYVPPPKQEPAPPSGGHRGLGMAAMVLGVIGIVISLVLAVGVMAGQAWLNPKVDSLAATVDSGLAVVGPRIDGASAKVGDIAGSVGSLAASAQAVADAPSPGSQVVAKFLTDVTNLSDRYLALRQAYAGVRETAVSALGKLETIDRFTPGTLVPQNVVDGLAALDAKLQAFDATIMGLINPVDTTGPINTAAAAVAQKAATLSAGLQDVSGALADVKTRLDSLRTQVRSAADTAKMAITFGAFGGALFFVYLAFLHWVLFRTGRQMRRTPVGG